MLAKLKKSIFNDFNKNSLTMLYGTVIAQALPLIFSPVLARLYSPAEFGAFSLFYSIVLVLGSISTGKLDLALYTAKSKRNAIITFLSSLVFTTIFFSLVFIGCIVVFFSSSWESVTGELLACIPLTVFLIGCSQGLTALSTREKKFKYISRAKVILGVCWVSINLILGFFYPSAIGLIIGYVIAQVASTVYLYLANKEDILSVKFSINTFKTNLIRNKNYAFIFLPAHVLNAISSNGPSFFLSTFFGLSANGFYFKAARIGESPTSVIKSSLGNVFWQQASNDYINTGTARKSLVKFLFKLIAIGTVPYLVAYLYADELFLFLFGAPWAESAKYFKIIAPYFFIQFIVSPVTIMVILSNKPWVDIVWQIFFALCMVISFSIGWYQDSIFVGLQWYAILMSIMQLVAFGVNYHYSVKR